MIEVKSTLESILNDDEFYVNDYQLQRLSKGCPYGPNDTICDAVATMDSLQELSEEFKINCLNCIYHPLEKIECCNYDDDIYREGDYERYICDKYQPRIKTSKPFQLF